MNKKLIQVRLKAVACCLTAAVIFGGSPAIANASVTAGSGSLAVAATPVKKGNLTSGVTLSLGQYLAQQSTAESQVTENEVPVVKSEFADIGVSNVEEGSYVNIRSEANAESEVVGKLYSNSAVTVLAVEGEWYQIHSGNCDGYIKGEFIIAGDEELAKSISTRVAISQVDNLNIRPEMSTEGGIIGQASAGETLYVVEELDGWVKVSTDDGEGYVSAEYVECKNYFKVAESKEEEEARLRREEEARRAREENNRKPSNNSNSGSNGGSNKNYTPPSGASGQAVADFACQFVGNPYVYGGSSLTEGADCSGFVMAVYAQFGVSLPHSSYALRSVGYEVSTSDMQPGDIICYSGHVAIYIGGNTIVHASNRRDGIKYTSPANYTRIITVRRIF